MGKYVYPATVRADRGPDEQDAPTDAELAKIVWPPLPWTCPGRCKREYRTHTYTLATLVPRVDAFGRDVTDPSTATFLCMACDFLGFIGAPPGVIGFVPEDV